MEYLIILIVVLRAFLVETGIVSLKYETDPALDEQGSPEEGKLTKTIMALDEEHDDHEADYDFENELVDEAMRKPCTIMLVSNVHDPTTQSLIRKYRYDAHGVLIPSSVKYFIKKPQGVKMSPILVPLNDKAFSPHGGFVRYYKEVPPIPRVS